MTVKLAYYMFTKFGKEPSWVLQFGKQEQIMMLAMLKQENDELKEIRKSREK